MLKNTLKTKTGFNKFHALAFMLIFGVLGMIIVSSFAFNTSCTKELCVNLPDQEAALQGDFSIITKVILAQDRSSFNVKVILDQDKPGEQVVDVRKQSDPLAQGTVLTYDFNYGNTPSLDGSPPDTGKFNRQLLEPGTHTITAEMRTGDIPGQGVLYNTDVSTFTVSNIKNLQAANEEPATFGVPQLPLDGVNQPRVVITKDNPGPIGRFLATSSRVIGNLGHSFAQIMHFSSQVNAAEAALTEPWQTSSHPLPIGRTRHTSVVANGYVYVIGGNASSTVFYAKLNPDGSTGIWQTSPNSLPAGRSDHSSVVVNGYVYVIGGDNDSSFGSQSSVFYAKLNADGSLDPWQTSPNSLPQPLQDMGVATANGYIYTFGGTNSYFQKSVVYYAKANADGTIGTWQTTSSGFPTQNNTGVAVTNGFVYAVGGSFGASPKANVYYAKLNSDGTIGAWTAGASLPTALQHHAAVIADGNLYTLGGETNGSVSVNKIFSTKLNADGSYGAWSEATNPLPTTLQLHSAVMDNSHVYVIGGQLDPFSNAVSSVYYNSFLSDTSGDYTPPQKPLLSLIGLSSTRADVDLFGIGLDNTGKVVSTLKNVSASVDDIVTDTKDLTSQTSPLTLVGVPLNLGDLADNDYHTIVITATGKNDQATSLTFYINPIDSFASYEFSTGSAYSDNYEVEAASANSYGSLKVKSWENKDNDKIYQDAVLPNIAVNIKRVGKTDNCKPASGSTGNKGVFTASKCPVGITSTGKYRSYYNITAKVPAGYAVDPRYGLSHSIKPVANTDLVFRRVLVTKSTTPKSVLFVFVKKTNLPPGTVFSGTDGTTVASSTVPLPVDDTFTELDTAWDVSMRKIINKARADKNLPALTQDNKLRKLAREHVYDEITHDIFGHYGSDCTNLVERWHNVLSVPTTDNSSGGFVKGFTIGENLGYGSMVGTSPNPSRYGDPWFQMWGAKYPKKYNNGIPPKTEDTNHGYYYSNSHRANLLNPDFKYIAVAAKFVPSGYHPNSIDSNNFGDTCSKTSDSEALNTWVEAQEFSSDSVQ